MQQRGLKQRHEYKINAVDQESSFPEFEKNVKHIEKIVTDEQKQVGNVVTHAHRVGGVLRKHSQNVDLTCVDLTCKAIPFCSTRHAH